MAVPNIRILVVDDNPGDLRLVREALAEPRFGRFEIMAAGTVAQALEKLAAEEIDAVLLDLGLPDGEGLETLRRVYAAAAPLPVIVLTGREDEQLGLQALQHGAEDYLIKGATDGHALSRSVRYAIERKLFLKALRSSQERYRLIVETAEEGIWVTDAADRTSFVNRKMGELLGYVPEEMIGRPFYAFLDPEEESAVRARFDRHRQGGREGYEFRLRRRDGGELWVRCAASPFFDGEGRYEGTLAMISDLSERRGRERAQAELASIVSSSEDAIYSKSLDGVVRSWNPGAERMYGYRAEEIVGSPVGILEPPDRRGEWASVLARLKRGERIAPFETVRRAKDGREVEVFVSVSAVLDAEGRPAGASAIDRDISEKRKLEHQLRQAQKMEGIGRLAGGIAHDFNNLITVITGYASAALEKLDPGAPAREDLEEIRKAGERAGTLTAQLLAFSRRQILSPRVTDLRSIVEGMEKMLRRLLGERIAIRTSFDADLGLVRVDRGQMEQVLLNLALNARDAIAGPGTLTIDVRNVTLDGDFEAAHPGARSGPHVCLAVSDTGCGMDAPTLAHLFEPFFTTKEPGKGTGLGLATVYGIVKQSGGYIGVESRRGAGSVFRIYLPRVEAEGAPPEETRRVDRLRGDETILVVEDERAVRLLAVQILKRNGYTVLEAGDAAEAIPLLAARSEPIHLILTDIVMPGPSVHELIRAARDRLGEVKVLYMTGHSEDELLREQVSRNVRRVLRKPFSPGDLLRQVRKALEEESRTPDGAGSPRRASG